MRFTWEASDVVAGVRVGKFNRTEQWIIGYDPSARSDRKWALISLEDGMISKLGQCKATLAEHLNATGDYPVENFPAMKRAADDLDDGRSEG